MSGDIDRCAREVLSGAPEVLCASLTSSQGQMVEFDVAVVFYLAVRLKKGAAPSAIRGHAAPSAE